MTKERLQLAGWVCMVNALFTIPATAMSFYLESMEGTETRIAQAILIIASLGLFIYILSSLKALLNMMFHFHEGDIYISYLLWGNLSLSLFLLFALANKEFESAVAILSVMAYIFFGILSILFARRLLKLPHNLYGLLKPYCYITLVSGACFVSVILLPVGILAGAITDGVLGVIFFRAAERFPFPDGIPGIPGES